MAKELVISSNRHETKVAVLEDEQLVEIHFQRANEYSLAGSIHKGRVTRVLPGMQSAFVDIGLERDAFLYVSDFVEETEEYDRIPVPAPSRAQAAPRAGAEKARAAVGEQESEWRDRRLRRARRRRPRGHGLPEAKYAKEIESEAARAAERDESSGFMILPGESLAKYREAVVEQAGPEGAPEAEDRAQESAATQEAAWSAGAGEDERAPAPGEVGEGQEAVTEEALAAESSLAIKQAIPEESLPEAQDRAESPEAEEDWATAGGDGEAGGDFESDAATGLSEEAEVTAEPGGDTAEADGEEEASFEEEAEEAAIEEGPAEQELVEAEAGGEEATPEEEQEEVAAPAEEAEVSEGAQAATSEEEIEPARMPVSLTATLREQGLRFPHRMSRRLRRKLRTPRGEEAERAASQAPAAGKEETAQAEQEERPPLPSITELLREGQEILVQIAKEPLGQKGARITSHITLPGRYVVYMPTVEHYGVSRKITSEEERVRLKRILHRRRAGLPGGFIVRTAGEGRSEEEIAADMQYLYNLWLDIRKRAESRKAPALIHHDLDLVTRTLRDELTEDFKTIWTDSEEVYESVLRFVQRFQPSLVNRVKLYTRPTPIFDAFNISQELEKALRPKVWLKSGGYIVINQTEALVAIDVNTGKFVGKSNRLEDTIFRTNTEAVKEIVRQIRLRDLGGIIVIDFIDMDERKNRQRVMQALEEAMRADRAPYKILQFNDFGLVAITRKRVKQSLERALCSPCPYCEGSGYVKSVQTVIGEILQEAHRIAGAIEGREVMLRVNPEVAKALKSKDNDYLEELEEILRRPVLVTSDPTLQQEKFDLA